MAFQYKFLGNNGEALKYYKQSYEMFNALENKSNFAKDLQNIESQITILEELFLNTQNNKNEDVSSVDSIIPDDDSIKDDSDAEVLGEVTSD